MKLCYFIFMSCSKAIHVDMDANKFYCYVGNIKFVGEEDFGKEMRRLAQNCVGDPSMYFYLKDELGSIHKRPVEWDDLSEDNRKVFADFCNNA